MNKLYRFKLADTVTVHLSGEPMAPGKGIQFVNTEKDAYWAGWTFEEAPNGIVIRPPWGGDEAFVPWSGVVFVKRRPEPKVADKKPGK